MWYSNTYCKLVYRFVTFSVKSDLIRIEPQKGSGPHFSNFRPPSKHFRPALGCCVIPLLFNSHIHFVFKLVLALQEEAENTQPHTVSLLNPTILLRFKTVILQQTLRLSQMTKQLHLIFKAFSFHSSQEPKDVSQNEVGENAELDLCRASCKGRHFQSTTPCKHLP